MTVLVLSLGNVILRLDAIIFQAIQGFYSPGILAAVFLCHHLFKRVSGPNDRPDHDLHNFTDNNGGHDPFLLTELPGNAIVQKMGLAFRHHGLFVTSYFAHLFFAIHPKRSRNGFSGN